MIQDNSMGGLLRHQMTFNGRTDQDRDQHRPGEDKTRSMLRSPRAVNGKSRIAESDKTQSRNVARETSYLRRYSVGARGGLRRA